VSSGRKDEVALFEGVAQPEGIAGPRKLKGGIIISYSFLRDVSVFLVDYSEISSERINKSIF